MYPILDLPFVEAVRGRCLAQPRELVGDERGFVDEQRALDHGEQTPHLVGEGAGWKVGHDERQRVVLGNRCGRGYEHSRWCDLPCPQYVNRAARCRRERVRAQSPSALVSSAE